MLTIEHSEEEVDEMYENIEHLLRHGELLCYLME